MLILIFFAFLAGIFTVLSPCILPILPALLSGGTAEGRLRPFGIVIGLVISFTIFTLSLTAIVLVTGLSANVLRYIAIGVVFLFGLVMMFPKLSDEFARLMEPIATIGQKAQENKGRSGFIGGLFLGFALGLLWTPCAGPILAAITTLVATQSVGFSTLALTLTYSLGAAIPMLLIASGGKWIVQSFKVFSKHAEGIRKFFGALMVLTAIAIALNWDMLLQQKIIRALPPVLVEDYPIVKEELQKLRGDSVQPPSSLFGQTESGELKDYGKAPEFTGIVNWINSPPLSLMQLQGKVVLVDFWTYSCINCLRTLPYIEKWYADYKKDGFVVIGVHTPEFEFEKDPKNVAEAAARIGVEYPIAQDNDYKTWTAYRNNYWPAHYLIDQNGNLRMVHYGEGAYVETENAIRELLGMAALKQEEKKQERKPISPETYLGNSRGHSYISEIVVKPNISTVYDYKQPLGEDEVGLKGHWTIEDERITADSDESYLDFNFLAKNVYLVLSGKSQKPIKVYLDNKLVNEIMMDGDRKYDIVTASYGRHQLSLRIPKGVSAYAFTFGNE